MPKILIEHAVQNIILFFDKDNNMKLNKQADRQRILICKLIYKNLEDVIVIVDFTRINLSNWSWF